MASFEDQVKKWVGGSKAKAEAALKTAVQDMTAEMNRPRARGGRMPIDTGFLTNSGSADGIPVAVALMRWRPLQGETFTYGWSANYAPVMNARYAFRDAPVQNWQEYVKNAVNKVR